MTVTRPALALCVLFLGTSVAVSAPSSIGTRRETKKEKSDPRRDDADSTVAGACRIEAGTTPDDFGEPNFCSESHQLTTQYVETQSIVFGTAANPSAPAVGMFKDTPLCPTECRMGADPPFTGDWWCAFALGTAPGVVGQQAFVSSFKANVCHVSIVMTMEALDRDFNVIDSASTNVFGGSDLTVNAPVGESIAYVRILSHLDENGVSIDCLEYPDPFLDDDADGVENCFDECPGSDLGEDVDADGCGSVVVVVPPSPVVIACGNLTSLTMVTMFAGLASMRLVRRRGF